MPRNRANEHENYKDDWATPVPDFDIIQNSCWKIRRSLTLDVAASKENAKCDKFFTKEDDALTKDWIASETWKEPLSHQAWYFLNCPFSQKYEFLKKAYEQLEKGNEGILILPASPETGWFRKYILHMKRPFLFYPKRIQFIDPVPPLPGEKPKERNTGGTVLVAFTKPDSPLPKIPARAYGGKLKKESAILEYEPWIKA